MGAERSGLEIASRSGGLLEGLYREYRTPLCAYVRRRFGPGPPEPEDIAQEAFARFAVQNDIRAISNPKAFLLLTARNLAIDAHRKMVRGNFALQSVTVLTEKDHDLDASDVVSSREDLERLGAIVDTLTPKQRVAFLMNRVDGLSFAEIGRRMRISASGARLLVDNALAICVARMRK